MSVASLAQFKRCSKCKVEYPRTFQFFHRGSPGKDRFHSQCRLCRHRGKGGKAALLASLFCPPGHSACVKCAEIKPATREHFHVLSTNPFSLRTDCIPCRLAGRKVWYDENRETAIKRSVESAKKNPNRKAYMAEYLPKWQEAHPTYYRDRTRQRRAKERSTPEGLALQRLKRRVEASKRRAAKQMGGGECTVEEIEQMYDDQQGLCAYCEIPLLGVYHADHMLPVSRGGSSDWSNMAISCPRCNIRKHTKTVEEFLLTL